MKLSINNLARINKAEISVDGITVIAGKNGTGKSTIGKAFFGIFNSLFGLDEKIKKSRKNYLSNYVYSELIRYYDDSNDTPFFDARLIHEISDSLRNYKNDNLISEAVIEMIKEEFAEDLMRLSSVELSVLIQRIREGIDKIQEIEDSELIKELIDRTFTSAFSGQINNLMNNDPALVELTVKGKNISLKFVDNICDQINIPVKILHEAFYIDNPFIIDDLYRIGFSTRRIIDIKNEKLSSALQKEFTEIDENLINVVETKTKLNEIYDKINNAVPGKFINNKGLGLSLPGYTSPLMIKNLSTGAKSFAILKRLLENGSLKENDVLILDEPEVHLHPEWQMKYAEIIVLLQKAFNLSLIITTHSVNFLQAIECYSKLHMIDNNCNYYLSTIKDGLFEFEDVTNNLSKIYEEMIEPRIMIDDLLYELENQDE